MAVFKPQQMKLGRCEGIEGRTTQIEFLTPQKSKSKILLTKKEERDIEKKKGKKPKREYGLEAYGVEKSGQARLGGFFKERKKGVKHMARERARCVGPVDVRAHCRRGCTIRVVAHTRSCPRRY